MMPGRADNEGASRDRVNAEIAWADGMLTHALKQAVALVDGGVLAIWPGATLWFLLRGSRLLIE